MKFKFCSDGDCPLWALAGLHALSSLPAPLFRTLLNHVMEEQTDDGIVEILKDTSLSSREECARAAAVIRWVVSQACACACSESALTRDLLVLGVPRAHAQALADKAHEYKQTHETSREECARAAAVIRWVVSQACACACSESALTRDLLVLGVPRAHAQALADKAHEYKQTHEENVRASGFMVNKVTDVAVSPGPSGSVDALKLSLFTADVSGDQRKSEVLISHAQVGELLKELKTAYEKMEALDAE